MHAHHVFGRVVRHLGGGRWYVVAHHVHYHQIVRVLHQADTACLFHTAIDSLVHRAHFFRLRLHHLEASRCFHNDNVRRGLFLFPLLLFFLLCCGNVSIAAAAAAAAARRGCRDNQIDGRFHHEVQLLFLAPRRVLRLFLFFREDVVHHHLILHGVAASDATPAFLRPLVMVKSSTLATAAAAAADVAAAAVARGNPPPSVALPSAATARDVSSVVSAKALHAPVNVLAPSGSDARLSLLGLAFLLRLLLASLGGQLPLAARASVGGGRREGGGLRDVGIVPRPVARGPAAAAGYDRRRERGGHGHVGGRRESAREGQLAFQSHHGDLVLHAGQAGQRRRRRGLVVLEEVVVVVVVVSTVVVLGKLAGRIGVVVVVDAALSTSSCTDAAAAAVRRRFAALFRYHHRTWARSSAARCARAGKGQAFRRLARLRHDRCSRVGDRQMVDTSPEAHGRGYFSITRCLRREHSRSAGVS